MGKELDIENKADDELNNKTKNKTEQNNRRYKAFISYRHQPFDRKVAVTLQKHLETFHPPKQLEKKEKWRVFRDETELPTSADLSQDIREALENSEYLIVICSSMLVQSKWCREEISYFKSLHNNSSQNILALLIEGNPGDVFPEELCWSEEIRKSAEGEEIREKIEVEPLAANITADSERKSLKKLKTEYLRIAAPLLGCRYDDLYQREQKRRIHRSLAIMGGVTVVVGGIGIYSSIMAVRLNEQKRLLQKENYNRMAVQADYMWEDGKVTEAIETAVDAIPDTEDNMSVYSAEKVAAEKLGVFQKENFLPIQKYETTSYITKVAFVNSGKNVVAQDATGVYLWETKSGKLVKKYTVEELESEENVEDLSIEFVLEKENSFVSVTVERMFAEGTYQSIKDEANVLMLTYYKKRAEEGDEKNPHFYIMDSSGCLWKVNSETGEYELFEEVGEEEKQWYIYDNYHYNISDGQLIRQMDKYKEDELIEGEWISTEEEEVITFENNDSKKKKVYQLPHPWVGDYESLKKVLSISDNICYAQVDGGSMNSCVAAYLVEDGVISDENLIEKEKIGEEEHLQEGIKCGEYYVAIFSEYLGGDKIQTTYRVYDYDTAKKICETKIEGDSDEYSVRLLKKEDTESYTDILVCKLDKKIVLIDINNGDIIYEYTFPSDILRVKYSENGNVFVMLKNGKEYMVSGRAEKKEVDESVLAGIKFHDFGMEIDKCDWYDDDYISVKGTSVYLYQDLTNEKCKLVEADEITEYQTESKKDKYSDKKDSKKIKKIMDKLQKEDAFADAVWGCTIDKNLFVFGRDGIFYKIDETSATVEESLKLREETEEESLVRAEDYNEITVWKTSNPEEVIVQNQETGWLVNIKEMEVRYQIDYFEGYSKLTDEVLMYNRQEKKYWICPLYTAEELKQIGTEWKYQTD